MENPFVFGGELEPGQVVDRDDEVQQVVRALTTRQKLFLIGPRRYGKTSILNVAEAQAKQQNAIILRHDAEAYPSFETFVTAIIAGAAQQLTGIWEKAEEKVVRLFSALRPEITYDGMTQSWSAGISPKDSVRSESTPLLVDALNSVAKLAANVDRPVAVIIDEFQHLIELGGESTERQLRAAIQRHTKVAYVFAGSKTTLLNDMTLNPARPFYRLGGRLFLGPVPRGDFTRAIKQGFTRARFTADDAAIVHILDLAEDVPYNVQALSNMAWEIVREDTRRNRLTVERVELALDRLVDQDGPFYSKIWNMCTSIQQHVLLAVVRHRGRGLFGAATLRPLQMAPSTMTKALAALESREIIRREDILSETLWRLEDPFMARWLRRIGASQG